MEQTPSSADESPLPKQPRTPPGKEILSFPECKFTPDALYRMSTLKRKASELSLSTPPKAGGGYVKWRILVVRAELDVVKGRRESLKEAFRNCKITQNEFEKCRATTFEEQEELEDEEVQLLGQGKFIEEDLNDSVTVAEEAYIDEIYRSWRRASSEGQNANMKEKRLAPNKFNNKVAEYLDAERESNGSEERFCSVLGIWLLKEHTKCAHLVPKSFDTKNLAYIFGANDAALTNTRNGIVMTGAIEGAFDNGWLAIVPDGSVMATPTQWKVVLLNDRVRKNTIIGSDSGIWHFEDLHNRKLTFQNDNRPARRYLFFRYVLAIMHAEYRRWDGYREKIPAGTMWASPDKPGGYLRKSVLRNLARRVHDEDVLPEELIEAGGFVDTDPPTGTDAANELADLEIGMNMRRECKKKAERIEDDSEEESDY